jgi:WD40 repeat protein
MRRKTMNRLTELVVSERTGCPTGYFETAKAGSKGRGADFRKTNILAVIKATCIRFLVPVLGAFAVLCGSVWPALAHPPSLLITSQIDKTVREYDGTTGAFVKIAAFGGALGDPLGVVIGLDGNLLVSDGQTNQVKRYNRATGAFMGVFASTNLSGPMGMTIHQGVLYVTNSNSPQGVQRFDAVTGVNTGSFVPSLANPHARDVKINPANNRLYVLYYNEATVETFDLTTMASFGILMPVGNPLGSGGLFTPSAMAFGPDGNLYISGGTFGGNLGVRRYNPTTGTFIDFFANTGSDLYVPIGITFGPDDNLYVATQSRNNVMRFNYPTGSFMDFFVPDGGGGLTAPFHITFTPEHLPVGGSVTGLDTTKARCVNRTTGDSVVISLAGITSWDCEAAGLVVNPGDAIHIGVYGNAE